MEDYILKTNKLSKKYGGKYVLKDISINIKRGDIYGFIGKNGAGKTTTIRIITGLSKVTSGTIEIFDKSTEKEMINQRKRIGSLIENPSFYEDMTAYDNMELLRLKKGIPGKSCIKEKLDIVGLKDIKNKKVKNFSLGMKQKLGLAMALLGDPEFLILDEPTNGLDPMGIVQMRELLKKLNREKGTTILISSHLLSELYQLATCYGIIDEGQLIEEISQEELNEKCKKALEIKVDDVKKASWVLENILNTINYKILPNKVIKIYDYIDKPGEISKALLNEGVEVYQIVTKGEDLEEYFMNVIGGEKC